jgi:hypothetical protein
VVAYGAKEKKTFLREVKTSEGEDILTLLTRVSVF